MRGVDPYGKITAFVENHTPEARKKREEEARKKQRESEEQSSKFAALKEQIETIKTKTSKSNAATVTVNNLLLRAKQQVETEQYDEANEYYKRALDADPTNAEAWWGLYLLEYDFADESRILDMLDYPMLSSLQSGRNYRQAKKYATGKFAERIQKYDDAILSFAQTNYPKLEKEAEEFDAETERLQDDIRQEVNRRLKEANEVKAQAEDLLAKEKSLTSSVNYHRSKSQISPVPTWSLFTAMVGGIAEKCDALGDIGNPLAATLAAILFILMAPINLFCVIFVMPFCLVIRSKNKKLYKEYDAQLKSVTSKRSSAQNKYADCAKQMENRSEQVEREVEKRNKQCDAIKRKLRLCGEYLESIEQSEHI